MKKGASNYERYIKGYFQLRLYIFIASIFYLISNYNFSFNIPRVDGYMFDIIYYCVIILGIFSGIYSYFLLKAITINKYKKIIYYINTSLLLLSSSIFVYGSFISSNPKFYNNVLILMPFLAFNIISWIVTRRIQEIHFINNEKFVKKSTIGWILLFIVYFTIGSIQPYNRVIHDRNGFELNLDNTSQGWKKLSEFNKKYEYNDLLFAYTDCSYDHLSNRSCFENEIFGEELSEIRDKYKNKFSQNSKNKLSETEEKNKKEEMKQVYFDSLKNGNYDKLVKIESEIEGIIQGKLFSKSINEELHYNKDYNINKIQSLYRLLIEYNIDIKNYTQANTFINNYYSFLIEYSTSETFGIYYLYRINDYYSLLEENNYREIIFPENIRNNFEYFKKYYPKLIRNNQIKYIHYSLPDILFILNKNELSRYYEYIEKDIRNQTYTFSYKPPFFYNSFNTFIYKFGNNFDYSNVRYQDGIEFFEELLNKSEK